MKTFQPLILFRVKIAVQPGIEKLVLAAHEKGTRDVGLLENATGAAHDRRAAILTILAVAVVVFFFARRRRRKRAA